MLKESARDDFAGMTSQLEIKADEINDSSFTSDGKHALTGAQGSTVQLWDVETGRCLPALKGHTAGVVNAAFSSDQQRVFSCDERGGIRVWDLSESSER